jgi:hypothetical protein
MNKYESLSAKLRRKILEQIDLKRLRSTKSETAQEEVLALIRGSINSEAIPLSFAERERLVGEVLDEVFGLGPGSVHLRSKWTPIRSAHFASMALIYHDVETAATERLPWLGQKLFFITFVLLPCFALIRLGSTLGCRKSNWRSHAAVRRLQRSYRL